MNIYLLRHGQTDYNVKKLIQGALPTHLNETGKKQVLEIKKDIDSLNIDLIISSPLERAIETSRIINQDRNLKIITDKRLEERGFGKTVGKKENIYTDYLDLYWDTSKNYKSPYGIEPIQDFLKRTKEFLDDIKENHQNKNILIVTHGSVVIALAKQITEFNKNEFDITNCTLLKFKVGD